MISRCNWMRPGRNDWASGVRSEAKKTWWAWLLIIKTRLAVWCSADSCNRLRKIKSVTSRVAGWNQRGRKDTAWCVRDSFFSWLPASIGCDTTWPNSINPLAGLHIVHLYLHYYATHYWCITPQLHLSKQLKGDSELLISYNGWLRLTACSDHHQSAPGL